MRILALDTTTVRESVALVADGGVSGEVRLLSEDGHSRRLMPAIAFLLDSLGLAPGDLDGYAVAAGPGSFTGLRVGLSTVQGLALASRRPCLGLSALDALAVRIRGSAPHLVALMNAHRGEVFGALYDVEARPLQPPRAATPEEILADLPPACAFLGDAVAPHKPLIEALCREPSFPERSLFLAGTLGLMAEPRLRAGEGQDPQDLRPLYLREPAIRRPGGAGDGAP